MVFSLLVEEGFLAIQFPKEAKIFYSSLPKKYSSNKYVFKMQTVPTFFQVSGVPMLPALTAGFWIKFVLSWIPENKHVQLFQYEF